MFNQLLMQSDIRNDRARSSTNQMMYEPNACSLFHSSLSFLPPSTNSKGKWLGTRLPDAEQFSQKTLKYTSHGRIVYSSTDPKLVQFISSVDPTQT